MADSLVYSAVVFTTGTSIEGSFTEAAFMVEAFTEAAFTGAADTTEASLHNLRQTTTVRPDYMPGSGKTSRYHCRS
jgi:hypothetical protein